MSCTVSELPSGCRLRGITSSAAAAAVATTTTSIGSGSGNNNGNGNGNGNGNNSGGGSSTATTVGGGIHVGGLLSTTSALSGGGGVGGGGGNSSTATMATTGGGDTQLQRPQSQKPCCFCWCCCCSCSCLAIKNADDNAPTKRDLAGTDLLLDGEEPSLDEVRSWGRSFDRLMRNAAGRKVFRDFLRSEFSEENILFWLACEELKTETCPETVEEKARLIYEDYISILSPREVSLDSHVREIVNRNMVEPTPHTFDEAQIQIYTLMHRDSYPRFLNSPKFKTLAQLQEGTSTAGSTAESPT